MKKYVSVLASLLLLPAFFGCSAANGPRAGAQPEASREEKIMITWFRYHTDLVEEIRCSSTMDGLKSKAEEAIAARQGIVRDLSQYQYEGLMSNPDVEVWYEKLRINLGTENIAYVTAYERLTGKTTSVNLH
jgi:hypothetical protein